MNLIFRGGYYLTVPKYSGRRKGDALILRKEEVGR